MAFVPVAWASPFQRKLLASKSPKTSRSQRKFSWREKVERFFSISLLAGALPAIKANSLLLKNMAKAKSPWSRAATTEGFTAFSKISCWLCPWMVSSNPPKSWGRDSITGGRRKARRSKSSRNRYLEKAVIFMLLLYRKAKTSANSSKKR